jgi:RNA polymerase sigma factor (sigma-70 family)
MNISERNATVTANAGLVYVTARRVWRNAHRSRARLEFADLVQAGFLGLIAAAEKFDRGRGVRFASYACRCIWAHMHKEIRGSPLIAVPAHVQLDIGRAARGRPTTVKPAYLTAGCKALGIRSFRVQRDDPEGATRHELETDLAEPQPKPLDTAFADDLERALADLDPERRALIAERFGLDGLKPSLLRETARRRGVTRQTIAAREKQILRRLRNFLECGARSAACGIPGPPHGALRTPHSALRTPHSKEVP